MDLNHLHLHVRDVASASAYYQRWFGFREHVCHGDILFLRNGDGFDLALAPDDEGEDFPTWFHFGFRLASAADVRDLHVRDECGDGAPIEGDGRLEPEAVGRLQGGDPWRRGEEARPGVSVEEGAGRLAEQRDGGDAGRSAHRTKESTGGSATRTTDRRAAASRSDQDSSPAPARTAS